MARQQELVQTRFNQGDSVSFVYLEFDGHGVPKTRVVTGYVIQECTGRPGFYYVRAGHNQRAYLVLWSDLVAT